MRNAKAKVTTGTIKSVKAGVLRENRNLGDHFCLFSLYYDYCEGANWNHLALSSLMELTTYVFRPSFFYFLFYQFFSQQVRVGGRNKNKNKIHLDHFPIELKWMSVLLFHFNSIGNGPIEFYF